MNLPPHDEIIRFPKGGVMFVKAPTSVYILFYTKLGRILTQIPVAYYILNQSNTSVTEQMVMNAWDQACASAAEKHLSRPDPDTVSEMVSTMKQMLELE